MDEKNFSMPLSLINGILQYLGTKPYAEVYQLVQSMQAVVAPQLQEQKPQEPKPEGEAA